MGKKFSVGFYVGHLGEGQDGPRVSDVLADLARRTEFPVMTQSSGKYQIRVLDPLGGGSSYRGVFAKYRHDDIPHVGRPAGDEREIALDEDEGLIEKNYFLYYRARELLVWQVNGSASEVQRLADYLGQVAGLSGALSPVVKADAIGRLMRNDVQPRSIEVSVARPTNPELYPNDRWSSELFRLMAGVGGVNATIRISGGGRGRGARAMLSHAKDAVVSLAASGHASVARVKVGGIEHPIDLIAERVKSKIDVDMNGRYPVASQVFAALAAAKDECMEDLDAYFGIAASLD